MTNLVMPKGLNSFYSLQDYNCPYPYASVVASKGCDIGKLLVILNFAKGMVLGDQSWLPVPMRSSFFSFLLNRCYIIAFWSALCFIKYIVSTLLYRQFLIGEILSQEPICSHLRWKCWSFLSIFCNFGDFLSIPNFF